MNNIWQTKKLGEVCDIYQPKTISAKEMVSDGKYVVFGANGVIGRYDKYNHEAPQLLITCRGATCGSVNISEPKAWITGNAMVIRPKDTSLDLKYLEYIFRGGIDISKVITGAAQPQITRSNLEPVEVNYPESLTEQHRIVKVLDEVFEKLAKAKENTEKNLQNSRELFESYSQNVFATKGKSWEEKKIGGLCDLMTGGTPSRSKKEYFLNGEIRWLVSGDVNTTEIFDCDGRITELGMQNSSTRFLPVNSIVIALNGQGKTRGTVAMLRIKATCNQSLVSIYPKNIKEMIPEYIYFNLKARYNEIRKITGDHGNDRRGLNMPLIRNIKISFPKSTLEQQKVVSNSKIFLAETKKLEEIYKQKLADLEELKKSILQKAFAGELVN